MKIAGSVDLDGTLSLLAVRRPVFHSEADFQFALAWQVQLADPHVRVHLEVVTSSGEHLDMAFEKGGEYTAIELKYITRKWNGTDHTGHEYLLKEHSAHDQRRYDVVKDIKRVEQFVGGRQGANGAVVLVTNVPQLWTGTGSGSSIDGAFHIGDGVKLAGERVWSREPADLKRRSPLHLVGQYELSWQDYSGTPDSHWMRLLVVEVATAL